MATERAEDAGPRTGPTGAPAEPAARTPLAAALGVLALLVVFVVVGLVEFRRDWYPGGDMALAELYVRQIPRHLVNTGPYSSSRGFFHPLPYGFYALWIPYEMFGRASTALLTGSVWFNGVVMAAVSWVLVRRGRTSVALLVVAALGIMVRSHPTPVFMMPWNPYLAALPFLALLVLASYVARGERWLVPAAVAVASWAAGVHLLFAPPTLAVLAVALGGLGRTAWRRRGEEPLARLVPPLAAAAGVGLVMWLPMLIDVARHGRGGNTAEIVRFMLDPGAPFLTGRDAIAVATSEFAWFPTWAGGHLNTGLIAPAMRFPLFLVLGVLAAVGAWRRGSRWEVSALGMGALAAVVATYGLARSSFLIGHWYLLPLRVSAIWFCAVTVDSLARSAWHLRARRAASSGRRVEHRRLPAAAVLGMWVGVALLVAWPQPMLRSGSMPRRPDVAAVVRQVPRDRAVVAGIALARAGPAPVGYLLALDRAGLEVHVSEHLGWYFGAWRARPAPPGSTRMFIFQAEPGDRPTEAGARLLERTEPVPQLFGPDLPMEFWLLP